MNFDFNEDQLLIKNDARRFLSDRCSMDMVREYLDGNADEVSPLWQEIMELGWMGVAIPEAYGGLGMGYLELCVLAEELGRVSAPVPFSSSIYLAAEALLHYGSEEQKQAYLPRLASGELIGAVAFNEPDAVIFRQQAISGIKRPVAHGALADIVILNALDDNGQAVLVLVDVTEEKKSSGDTLQCKVLNSVDPSVCNAELSFDGCPAVILGSCNDALSAVDNLLSRGAVLLAFEQIGGADRCLELAVEHVKERKTFGRVVGSYQSVKHKLAKMYTQNELARSNAYYGAWALASASDELAMAASSARISAIDCFEYASREGLHLHGGMGYTWEVDCHLYLKRSRDLSLRLRSSRYWKEKLVTLTLEAAGNSETVPPWLANA